MDPLLYFDHNEKSSVLLVFFCHAVIFSFLFLRKGVIESQNHNKWLGLFVFLGALYICPFMCGYADWYGEKAYREFLFFMPLQQVFLLGPVFFFFVRSLLNSKWKLKGTEWLHLLPAGLYLIYSLIVFVTDKLILDEFYFYADGRDKDLDFWYQMAGLISMLFYLGLSLRYYFQFRKFSVQELSYADEIAFKWIQHFAIAFSLILVIRVLFFILNPEWGEFGSKYWYYLCFSILIQYISLSGYANTVKSSLKSGVKMLFEADPPENESALVHDTEKDETLELEGWKGKITNLFESENLHRKPNLTLTELANHLNTNRNIISKVINQEFEMNFNDFVNQKRAEAVIEKLKQGEHVRNTLLAIALDCGFNSKTTFNRAFKKYAGSSPKQFIEQNAL